jgi:3-oxoacyl-[acyl-carrier-protein] synthase III
MKIAALAFKTPSLEVTNAQLLDRIRDCSSNADPRALDAYCRLVGGALAGQGARARYFRDVASGEKADDVLLATIGACLDDGGVKAREIDLVIYCGVGRGFVEPANAAYLCARMGIACQNFDLAEACMSWVRALHTAWAFLRAGLHSKILVVNGEFNATAQRMRHAFAMKPRERLHHALGALTVGEAATATLLVASDREWTFRFASDPSKFGLCTLPFADFDNFVQPSREIGIEGADNLVSFGAELFASGREMLLDLVRANPDVIARCALLVPHAATATMYDEAASVLGLEGKLYNGVFPRFGNLVSASVPAGLYHAVREGRLRRGDRVAFCPVSAGMSAALADTVY